MTRVLILLTLPQEVTAQYRDRLRAAFPEVTVDLAAHHAEAEAMIGPAQVLGSAARFVVFLVIFTRACPPDGRRDEDLFVKAMRRDPAADWAARFARDARGVNLVGRFVAERLVIGRMG